MVSIEIKLAVDRSRNSVLFADVGSEFVDVLLTFVTLPFSAVQFSVAAESSPGCLSNLSESLGRLRVSNLLKVDACHGMLLSPPHTHDFSLCKSTRSPSGSLFSITCKYCNLVMARLMHVYEKIYRTEMFVCGKERFVISDDCTVKLVSTSSLQSLPQAFASDGTGLSFEEIELVVGWEQILAILKASLSSRTVLTDVFLSKGTKCAAVPATVETSISLPSDRDSAGSLPESKIKIFYDTGKKKVMYAECNHDFVDLLLGFMTYYPVSTVIKNTAAGTCHRGRCFDNLYRSVTDLDDAGCLKGGFSKMKLLDQGIMLFDMSSHAMCRALECCQCHPELVEDAKYVVGDDLIIQQASAISVMKHWRGRKKAMVLEMDIAVEKQEAVALLRAAHTSNTTLTDVFIDRLEEHSSLQKFQLFVWMRGGKTITVEAARSDTIATVKSRIKDKVSIPAGYRHELLYGRASCHSYLNDSYTVAQYNLVRECSTTSSGLMKLQCELYKKTDILYSLLDDPTDWDEA